MNEINPEEYMRMASEIFSLKRRLREKIKEWEHSADVSRQPQTQRWYRFMAQDVEKLLKEHQEFYEGQR